MHQIEPVIDKIRHDPVDGLACAAAETVISKAGGKPRRGDTRELVSGIPGIGGCVSRIRFGAQVAVQIVGLGVGSKRRLLVVGVVPDRGENGWDGDLCEGSQS